MTFIAQNQDILPAPLRKRVAQRSLLTPAQIPAPHLRGYGNRRHNTPQSLGLKRGRGVGGYFFPHPIHYVDRMRRQGPRRSIHPKQVEQVMGDVVDEVD